MRGDEIELMIDDCVYVLDSKSQPFTAWEIDFIMDMHMKVESGGELTNKQELKLKELWEERV